MPLHLEYQSKGQFSCKDTLKSSDISKNIILLVKHVVFKFLAVFCFAIQTVENGHVYHFKLMNEVNM